MTTKQQQRSDRTFTVFIVLALGAALLVALLVWLDDDKDADLRRADREKVEAWCSIQDDELQELAVRRAARENCQRMTEAFRAHWGVSP